MFQKNKVSVPRAEKRGWKNVVRDKDKKYTEPDYFISRKGQGRVIEKISERL